MKLSIIVTDDDGNTFQGEAELTASGAARPARTRANRGAGVKTYANSSVNLSSPIRAFVKKHARGMGGPQKFALLVAYMSKGDTHKQVPLADIKERWNKMKPPLDGKFNPAHTIRAKEHEWVDSPKMGMYVLLPGWKGIFSA